MAICSVKQVMQTNNLLGTDTFVGFTWDTRLVVMRWWTNIDISYTLEYLLIINYVISVFFTMKSNFLYLKAYSWRQNLWDPRFRQFLSPGCVNFKNLCAHQQEEVLRIPKHPNMWNLRPSYGTLKKIKVSQNNFDWRLEKGSQNIAFLEVS